MSALWMLGMLLAQPPAGHVIAGQVVDAQSGQPLERVHLVLVVSGSSRPVAETRSGAGGAFRFAAVAAGKYSLEANRNRYGRATYGAERLSARYSSAVVVGPGVSAEELVFRMHPSAAITGNVVDEFNEGVAGLQVYALRVSGEGEARKAVIQGSAQTDERGQFRLHTLPGGRYLVASSGAARMEGFRRAGKEEERGYPTTFAPGVAEASQAAVYEVAEGGTAEATLRLKVQAAVTVSGKIPVAKETGNPYVRISTPVFQGQLPARTSQWAHEGRFAFYSLTPGPYRFSVVYGNRLVVSREFRVDAEHTQVDLTEPAPASVAVRMRVLNGGGERTLVSLVRADGLGNSTQVLDGRGEAMFESVAAGAYRISVQSGMKRGHTPLAVKAEGAALDGSQVVIPETGEVKISATADMGAADVKGIALRDGKAQAGLLVLVVRAEAPEDESGYRMDQSDSDGSFTWRDLAAGRYLAFCFDGGDETELGTKANVARWLERAQPLTIGADRREPVRIELTRPAPEK